MSESESEDSLPADKESRRLKDILYSASKTHKKPGACTMSVDFQKLDKDARDFVERIGESLVAEVPRALHAGTLGSEVRQNLDIKDHEAFLTEQTSLVIEERKREIQTTQKRLEKSLRELATVKQKEEEILKRKVKDLQKEYAESMKALQKQFTIQAEELRQEVLTKLAQQRSQCEMAVEAKARSLSASLATGNRACSPSFSTQGHRTSHHPTVPEEPSNYSDPSTNSEAPVAVHRWPPRVHESPAKTHGSQEIRRLSLGVQEARNQKRDSITSAPRRQSSRSAGYGTGEHVPDNSSVRSEAGKRRDLIHLLDSDED